MGSVRGCNWSITINNPTEEDYTEIEALKSQVWVKKWEGQLEHPEGGILHIQARLNTDYVRWGRVKTALTRAHIEKANNALALTNYVHKPETRVGEIPTIASRFMTIQQFYPILASFTAGKIADDIHESAVDVTYSFRRADMVREHSDRVQTWKSKYDPLKLVSECAAELIRSGTLGIEYIVTNPATKTMFKTFFWDIILRSFNE